MSVPDVTAGSPFDAIRQTRPDGTEFWSARDLCQIAEYETWRNFAAAIDRAKLALQNSGESVSSHVVEANKLVQRPQGGSIRQEDFELSRFGAYLVVMNGDPRKRGIADAQAYFAIQTRVAETQAEIPGPARAELLTRADLARMVLEAEEEKAIIAAALESAAPAIAYHERYVSNDDAVLIEVWATQFGITKPAAFELLREKKAIYRKHIGRRWSEAKNRTVDEFEYRPYGGFIDWFDLRPQHNAPRHHNGQVRQTLYVRQAFALQLAEKCGLTQFTLDVAPTDRR